jgi:hypothetical protein
MDWYKINRLSSYAIREGLFWDFMVPGIKIKHRINTTIARDISLELAKKI